jgi:hypothetical protein
MKTLILSLALLVLLTSAPNVMAGGGYGSAFQEQWKAVQAQQKRDEARLSEIDRQAARVIAGTGVQAGSDSTPRQSAPSKRWLCLACRD